MGAHDGTGAAVRRGLTSDLLWTTLTSLGVLFANFLLAALLARRGAVEVYEPFNLAKRIGAAALPFLTLGLTVGVVNHIASSVRARDRATQTLAALMLVGAAIAVVTVTALLAPATLSRVLLGDVDLVLFWAVIAYSFSLVLNGMVYAFYRAERRQHLANLTNIIAVAVVPILVVLLAPAGWSVHRLLFIVSGSILLWNGGQLALRAVRALAEAGLQGIRAASVSLLGYSVPRIPSGVAVATLVVLPPLFARQAGDLVASSFLLAGLSSVQLAGASVQAFGIVLLPRVSELHAGRRYEEIRSVTWRLLTGAIVLTAVVTPVAVALMPVLMPLWLGPEFAEASGVAMVTVLAVPGIVVFSVLRSVADGAVRAPVNTYAAIAGLAVAALGMAFLSGPDPRHLAWWYVVGQTFAAAGCAITLAVRFSVRPPLTHAFSALVTGLVLAAAVRLAAVSVGSGSAGAVTVLVAAGIAVIAALGIHAWWFPEAFAMREHARRVLRRGRRS